MGDEMLPCVQAYCVVACYLVLATHAWCGVDSYMSLLAFPVVALLASPLSPTREAAGLLFAVLVRTLLLVTRCTCTRLPYARMTGLAMFLPHHRYKAWFSIHHDCRCHVHGEQTSIKLESGVGGC